MLIDFITSFPPTTCATVSSKPTASADFYSELQLLPPTVWLSKKLALILDWHLSVRKEAEPKFGKRSLESVLLNWPF